MPDPHCSRYAFLSFSQQTKRPILFSLARASCIVFLCATLTAGCSKGGDEGYKTVSVRRGALAVDITATGTVEPEEVVDVGAQVAGQIVSLGTDTEGKLIDYGSQVEEGMVLARIDESLYQSDVAQADAQLKRARADLAQLQAKLVQAERDWNRAQKLGPSDALSQSAYDGYRAAFESAKANVTVGQAAIVQADAQLERAQRNLGFTVIKSPVKGVIIDRRVNIGQTVVSSLNTPSLFLIAKDLRRMEVWVSVNEADIGKIFPGQTVAFTVDAFPSEMFHGTVRKIRLNASMTQNVVTYVVEVAADNQDGKLLPYLTANVRFEISRKEDVLLVPNAALRYEPSKVGRNSAAKESEAEKEADSEAKEDQAVDTPANGSSTNGLGEKKGSIWILEDGAPKKVDVIRSASDGVDTEVESPQLKEGDLVITGEETVQAATTSGGTNPFAPTMPRGGRRAR